MPLDTATVAFLELVKQAGGKPLHEMTPVEARAFGSSMRDLLGEGPAVARLEPGQVNYPGGSFDVKVIVPEGTPKGVIIYYHGGGWVIGHIDEYETLGRKLAQRCGCTVVLPNYRLAPEHRFPTAVDDAYAALEWTQRNVERLAGRAVPLIVAGDSAGGNLAAVVARRARDRQGPAIALQVLIYPVTDADMRVPSYIHPENQLLLSREGMVYFWDHYLPQLTERSHPDAAPLREKNLAGLPPAVVFTAEYDPLRDEGEAYAARLLQAGVPVQFCRFLGQMHGFFTLVNLLPASDQAIDQVARAIDARLALLSD